MPFTSIHTMEPHHRRRLLILQAHPEIRALFGFDRWTIAITVAVVAAQLGLAWVLSAREASLGLTLGLASAVGAVLSHWAGQAIHETAHHLACRTPRGNRLLAFVANVPMIFPIAATFHRYHLDHHRFLGVETKDTDLPHALELRLVGSSTWRKALWLFAYFFVYALRGLSFVKRPSRLELLNALVQVLVTGLVLKLLGVTALVYLAASTIAGHSLHPVAAHFIHEHYVFERGQETYSYYGPLNLVTFNVGYHVEHHDFMKVPGSRLPKLRALAREHYEGLCAHRSWTWVLWHFITSRHLGVHSRLVRTEADFASAKTRGAGQPFPAWRARPSPPLHRRRRTCSMAT